MQGRTLGPKAMAANRESDGTRDAYHDERIDLGCTQVLVC